MILRTASRSNLNASQVSQAKPASKVFIESQKEAPPPYAIVFQAEHSRLAGALASGLRDEVFGELPPEVIQAIGEHDYGWQASDQSQINSRSAQEPRPFPKLSTEETVPSWNESIGHAHQIGQLQYVMVSRHFTLLGAADPERADFAAGENRRRAEVEHSLAYSADDLNRWTAAIGFCDLLSLYLCSGSQAPVEFPLAHPANPRSSEARKVTLVWRGNSPQFSAPILKSDITASLNGSNYTRESPELTPVKVEWIFS
ncbi:MAG: DUF3891 family protein [Bryobacteraceae bacterium]